ncbi:hypothetical protein [Kribbella catacumbae]|uniref:hypothetical protein n=1 Tax=Kribbella catacumbae TaxID=460086 RepID=UPI000363AFF5|nr:hypothetical protein [Kribbella catacumbae]
MTDHAVILVRLEDLQDVLGEGPCHDGQRSLVLAGSDPSSDRDVAFDLLLALARDGGQPLGDAATEIVYNAMNLD